MKLYSIVVDAENAYDTVGFAELRIYPPIMANDEFISTKSVIEAINCNVQFSQHRQKWTEAFACDYFIDGKIKEKEEFSYQNITLDFSRFSDDTVIQYNIAAGDNYRTEPKEQTKPNDPS